MAAWNQFNSILSAIKRCFSRSPIRRAALEKSKHPTQRGPRGGAKYVCCDCADTFGLTDVQVDHINPIVPIGIPARELGWDTIIARTFCEQDNLQVLCKKCHKEKSKWETTLRKRYKNDVAKRKG